MKKIITSIFSFLLVLISSLILIPKATTANDISIEPGADITSRFIYRGIDLGSSPQVQPNVALHYGNFNFTLWGSHPIALTPDEDDYKEVKFWMNYTFDAGNFTVTPQLENHFDANANVLDFDDETTTHVLQASLRFAGKGDLAPDLFAGYAFWGHQDLEPTIYIETGLNASFGDVQLRPFISGQQSEEGGFVDMDYGGDFVINQIGLTAGRQVEITERITLPLNVTFAINPETEQAFTAFSVSF